MSNLSDDGRQSEGEVRREAGRQDDVRQFVIFHLEDEMFAVPLSEVQEIVRVPSMVRMPLSPRALDGLANLRGTVLPVLNLRSVFNFPQRPHDDATRVVVLDHGRPIGVTVDRMANVVSVDTAVIEPMISVRSTVDSEFVTGMIKAKDGSSMVMILDAKAIIQREFQDVDQLVNDGQSARAMELSDSTAGGESGSASADESQLVSFLVADQEYAFPIEEVQEIVQVPSRITQVPNVRRHVLGVINLRNRLLPLVSLREMFGLPHADLTEANKIVVVSLGAEGAMSVGVVMDSIREVLRVSKATIDAVPTLLSASAAGDEVRAICRLDGGRRMVSILSAQHMFNGGDIDRVAGQQGRDRAQAQQGGTVERSESIGDEEQFVVFRLLDEEYGVPIDAVQEIVRVPDELTRVPMTPDFIEGVINLRGTVLPVIDQRRRFGLPELSRNDRQRIMVFTVRGVRTGFIVDQVSEVMRIGARFIDAAPRLSEEQQRLIRRVANLELMKRIILLLDVNELLNMSELDAIAPGEAVRAA